MPKSNENILPVIIPGNQFADELLDLADSAVAGDRIGISTMQVAPQLPDGDSPVLDIARGFINAANRGVEAKITADAGYIQRMSRVGNRDIPMWLPLAGADDRAERTLAHELAQTLLARLAFEGVLVATKTESFQRGYTPHLRQVASLHPLQSFATRHAKEAHIERENGETIAWITSANLCDTDLIKPTPNLGMNNLSFKVEGELARFAMQSMQGGFGRIAGSHRFGDQNTTIIHDINNSGEPALLPSVQREVLAAIDPRRAEIVEDPTVLNPKEPTHILLLSQYLPDGLLRSALSNATMYSDVIVPKQPVTDHRSRSFPYTVLESNWNRRVKDVKIQSTRRPVPSHVKALVVRYDDGTARIIGGTDNFSTHLQKFVRNEELAIIIDLDFKSNGHKDYFDNFIQLLHVTGEITVSQRDSLM